LKPFQNLSQKRPSKYRFADLECPREDRLIGREPKSLEVPRESPFRDFRCPTGSLIKHELSRDRIRLRVFRPPESFLLNSRSTISTSKKAKPAFESGEAT